MKRDEVIATLREHEGELRAEGVVRLGVFGSVARDEATEASDVDLVIAFDAARDYSLVDQERVRSRLAELLGTDVDLAVEPLRKARLRQRVEAEAVFAFRDPQDALEDILENIARIERFIEDVDEQAFYNDDKTIFSVNYALLAISEAARRLGGQAEALCPDIPWMDIRGLGNWLRHGYDSINPKTIWSTVQNDLRPLQLAAHLALIGLEERAGPDEPGPGR